MFDNTVEATDAEVKAALAEAQREAHRLYQLALAAPSAPTNALRASWRPASMETPSPGLMLPARQLRAMHEAALTAARAAVDFYSGFLRDHGARSQEQREQMQVRDSWPAAPSVPVAHAAPTFSAGAFLADLARRGIAVSAQDEKLAVAGANKLTADDRRIIAEHKAELLTALADSQEIF